MCQLPLILMGGGGHCRSVIEAAESSGRAIAGILDPALPIGTSVLGYPVLGNDTDVSRLVDGHEFVITVGHISTPAIRRRIAQVVADAEGRLATVVARSAVVSRHATIGYGTVVLHNAVVNAGAHIGCSCIINTGAIIEHDTMVGDYCHVSTGAILNGQSHLGDGSFLGSGCVVAQCVEIAGGTVVGAGTTIVKNIIEPGVYFGHPVKKQR